MKFFIFTVAVAASLLATTTTDAATELPTTTWPAWRMCNPIDSNPSPQYLCPLTGNTTCCPGPQFEHSMEPSCYNPQTAKCCPYWISSTVCAPRDDCCGSLGTGASSSAFCCKAPTKCCKTSEDGESSCWNPATERCCHDSSGNNGYTCKQSETCCGYFVCCDTATTIPCGCEGQGQCCRKGLEECVDGTCQWVHTPTTVPSGEAPKPFQPLILSACKDSNYTFVADSSGDFFCVDIIQEKKSSNNVALSRHSGKDNSIVWRALMSLNSTSPSAKFVVVDGGHSIFWAGRLFDILTGKHLWTMQMLEQFTDAAGATAAYGSKTAGNLVWGELSRQGWHFFGVDVRSGRRSFATESFPGSFIDGSNFVAGGKYLCGVSGHIFSFRSLSLDTGKVAGPLEVPQGNGAKYGVWSQSPPVYPWPAFQDPSVAVDPRPPRPRILWSVSNLPQGFDFFGFQGKGRGYLLAVIDKKGYVEVRKQTNYNDLLWRSPFNVSVPSYTGVSVPQQFFATHSVLGVRSAGELIGIDTQDFQIRWREPCPDAVQYFVVIFSSPKDPVFFLHNRKSSQIEVRAAVSGKIMHTLLELPGSTVSDIVVSDDAKHFLIVRGGGKIDSYAL